jgi:hypothetical protein
MGVTGDIVACAIFHSACANQQEPRLPNPQFPSTHAAALRKPPDICGAFFIYRLCGIIRLYIVYTKGAERFYEQGIHQGKRRMVVLQGKAGIMHVRKRIRQVYDDKMVVYDTAHPEKRKRQTAERVAMNKIYIDLW